MKEENCMSALMMASAYGHVDVVQLLLSHNVQVTNQESFTSVLSSDGQTNVLPDHGAKVDMQDNDGWSALIHASHTGHT